MQSFTETCIILHSIVSNHQKEEEGVMTVKFKDAISAQACIIVSSRFSVNGSDRLWWRQLIMILLGYPWELIENESKVLWWASSKSDFHSCFILVATNLYLSANEPRLFSIHQITAELYSGKERFKQSGTSDESMIAPEDVEVENKKRWDEFARWLVDGEGEDGSPGPAWWTRVV